METIFMNTENSQTNKSLMFRLILFGKLDLKNSNENIALANLSIYYTWNNMKSEYNNNEFKISAPNWNDEFRLSDGSCSVSDIQDYFEYIIKENETIADNLPIQIYAKLRLKQWNNEIIRKYKTSHW